MNGVTLHTIRWVLTNIGAALAMHGWLNSDQSNQLTGAIITAIPLIWGAIHNYEQDRKVKQNGSIQASPGAGQ